MANTNFSDVVRFTAASGGTGSFVVSAAVIGYQTPLTAGSSNFNYRYRAESADLSQWEIGTGAYTSSTTTLTRAPLFNSALGSSTINFSAAPQVAFVFLSEDFNATGQIPGTATNDSASAGNIGEFVSSTVSSGSAVSLTTGSAKDITTISLGAGDWDSWGLVAFLPAGTTTVSALIAYLSTTANTNPPSPNGGADSALQCAFTTGAEQRLTAGTMRLSLSASATISLGALSNFGISTMTAYGFIGARRRR